MKRLHILEQRRGMEIWVFEGDLDVVMILLVLLGEIEELEGEFFADLGFGVG